MSVDALEKKWRIPLWDLSFLPGGAVFAPAQLPKSSEPLARISNRTVFLSFVRLHSCCVEEPASPRLSIYMTNKYSQWTERVESFQGLLCLWSEPGRKGEKEAEHGVHVGWKQQGYKQDPKAIPSPLAWLFHWWSGCFFSPNGGILPPDEKFLRSKALMDRRYC